MSGRAGRRGLRAGAVVAVATIGLSIVPQSGGAVPVVSKRCLAQGAFHGSASEAFPGVFLWYWSLRGHGTCGGGAVRTHDVEFTGIPFGVCSFPGPATDSPSYPYPDHLVGIVLTDRATGKRSTLRQAWYIGFADADTGTGIVEIHRRWNVPSRYIPIGGITGLGTLRHWAPKVDGNTAKLSTAFVLTFGTEEVPGTDAPDDESC